MESVFVGRHIQIDNVAFLKWSRIRNSMANNFIYRGATTARESVIVQRRRVSSLRNDKFVDNSVNFFSCHACFDRCMTSIQSLSRNFTHSSQFFNVFFVVNRNFLVCQSLEMLVRLARRRVIWLVNVSRDGSFSLETVWVRPHGSCIDARISLLFLLLVG